MDSSPRFEPLFFRRYANCAGIPFLLFLFLSTLFSQPLLLLFLLLFVFLILTALSYFSRYRKEFLFVLAGLALASVIIGVARSDRVCIGRFVGTDWEGEGRVITASSEEITVKLRLPGVFFPVEVKVESEEERQVGEILFFSLAFSESNGEWDLCARENDPAQQRGRNCFYFALGQVRARLQKELGVLPQGSFYRAVLLGDRSGLSAEVKDAFRRTASSHLLAISGLHVTQILWFFHLFLSLLPIPEKGRKGILIFLLPLLFFLTGGSVSVFRASVMTAFPLLGGLLHRRSDSVTALIFAGVLLCACDPACITDPSFLLSFFATFSILVAASPFCRWLWETFFAGKGIFSKFIFWVHSSFVISVFSSVFLFPFQILLFSEGNILAPLFALILIPLFTPCLLVGLMSCFLVLLPFHLPHLLSLLSHVPQWFLSLVLAFSRLLPPTIELTSPLLAFAFLLILSFVVLSRARIRRLFLFYIGMFLCGLISAFF